MVGHNRLLMILLLMLAPAASTVGQMQLRMVGSPRHEQPEATRVVLEKSREAGELLQQFNQAIKSENYDVAASAAVKLSALGPERLLPGTAQGARYFLRQQIYNLPPDVRQSLSSAMAEGANAALAAAESTGLSEAGLVEVYLGYPGAEAGSNALKRLWAQALEQGRFEQAADWLDLHTEDPALALPDRVRSLTLLAFCGSMLGRNDILDHVEARLPNLPADFAFSWAGQQVVPANLLRNMRQQLRTAPAILAPTGILSSGEPRQIEWPGRAVSSLLDERSHGGEWLHEAGTQSRAELLRMKRQPLNMGLGSAVASEDRLFSIAATQVTASDLHSGQHLWTRELEPHAPATHRGGMAVQGQTSTEHWLVRADGRLVVAWSGSDRSRPDANLAVLDEANGQIIWQWRTSVDRAPGEEEPTAAVPPADIPPAPHFADKQEAALFPTGVPLVHSNRIYIVAINNVPNWQSTPADAYLVCLDLSSGRRLWSSFLGSDVPTNDSGGWSTALAAPVSDGRRIYVHSGVHSLAAVDRRTGEVVWAREFVPGDGVNVNPFRMPGHQTANVRPVPLLIGDNLLISSGRNGQLWLAATSSGAVQWQVDESLPLVLGVHRDLAVLGDIGSNRVVLRRLSDGAVVRTFQLRHALWGRGLLVGTMLLAPTDAGLLSLDIESGNRRMLVETEPAPAQPVAVTATDDGFVYISGTRIYTCTDFEKLLARLEAGRREQPLDMKWLLRLASVHEQQKQWSEAEALLKQVLDATADQPADGSFRSVAAQARRRMAALCVAWAEDLPESDGAAKLQKWRQALMWSDTVAARRHVLLNIGRVARSLQLKDDAVAAYRQARDLAGDRTLMPIMDTDGVRRSPAALATAALAELERTHAAANRLHKSSQPAKLDSSLLSSLEVHRLALLSWAQGGMVLADEQDSLVPVIWLRQDGLVAFGRQGEIIWMSNSAGATDFDGWLFKDRIIERRGREYTTRDRRTGRLVGLWLSEGAAVEDQAQDLRLIRRIIVVDGQVIELGERARVAAIHGPDNLKPLPLADGLLLSIPRAGGGHDLVMLDGQTGRPRWSRVEASLRGVFPAGDGVMLAGGHVQGTLLELLSSKDGSTTWRHQSDITERIMQSFVNDQWLVFSTEIPDELTAIRLSGQKEPEVLREGRGGRHGDVPVSNTIVGRTADSTILLYPRGLVSVDDQGRELWRLHGIMPRAHNVGAMQPFLDSHNTLLVLAAEGTVYGIDMVKGRVLWQHEHYLTGNQQVWLIRSGDVIVTWASVSLDAELAFLDRQTGKLLGRLRLGASLARLIVEPIAGGFLVINGNEVLTVTYPDRDNRRPLALLN